MKIILSPAKTMKLNGQKSNQIPPFYKEAMHLRSSLKSMSVSSMASFFNISTTLSQQTKTMFQMIDTYEAWDLFDGIAFKTLKEHLQEHVSLDSLMILSGLYGIVYAKDGITPYRLDLKHPKKGNLTAYFQPKIYQLLQHESVIYALVSKEYQALLDASLPIVYFSFLYQEKNAPSVDAKKLRGYIAANLLNDPNTDLKAIQYLGYRYQHTSTKYHIIYAKQ